MSGEQAGRVALVTGAAKGIGAAAATALAEQGVRVVLLDRDLSPLPAPGRDHLALTCDVSDAGSVEQAVQQAADECGRLDVLVNAAGIQRYGDVASTSVETWTEVLGTNLTGAFLLSHFAMPHLLATGDGAVVNVASVQAFVAQRGVAAYAASKGGLVALTNAMAVDGAPTVRVNCIAPGSVDTPMLRNAAQLFTPDGGTADETVASWGRMHPLGRPATAQEVADAIVYLAGPRASFITGSVLRVDGGLLSVLGGT